MGAHAMQSRHAICRLATDLSRTTVYILVLSLFVCNFSTILAQQSTCPQQQAPVCGCAQQQCPGTISCNAPTNTCCSSVVSQPVVTQPSVVLQRKCLKGFFFPLPLPIFSFFPPAACPGGVTPVSTQCNACPAYAPCNPGVGCCQPVTQPAQPAMPMLQIIPQQRMFLMHSLSFSLHPKSTTFKDIVTFTS